MAGSSNITGFKFMEFILPQSWDRA